MVINYRTIYYNGDNTLLYKFNRTYFAFLLNGCICCTYGRHCDGFDASNNGWVKCITDTLDSPWYGGDKYDATSGCFYRYGNSYYRDDIGGKRSESLRIRGISLRCEHGFLRSNRD